MIYSRILGIDMIIINSETAARELLDKRSAIYSDRPVLRTNELYVLVIIQFLLLNLDLLMRAELGWLSVLCSFRMAKLCNDTARFTIKSSGLKPLSHTARCTLAKRMNWS